MRTIKLTIEYDGTRNAGWQIEPHRLTVQGTIQEVLRRITGEEVDLIGASRTDAGVHARGQVAHFRTRSRMPIARMETSLNGLLPRDISIRKVTEAADGFHAQRGAKKKTYRYLIWNHRTRSALFKDRVWHIWTPLNLAAMRKGARFLVGRHDFSSFRASRSDTKTSVREIYSLEIKKIPPGPPFSKGGGGDFVQVTITANGFLKYMVRNIVGTLVEVGRARRKADDMKWILKSKDRKKAGATAPASGLYLVGVVY